MLEENLFFCSLYLDQLTRVAVLEESIMRGSDQHQTTKVSPAAIEESMESERTCWTMFKLHRPDHAR